MPWRGRHDTQASSTEGRLSQLTSLILMCTTRCEVSEHATHRSAPHGPCEPSARVTGQARTYTTDLPKWDSTLPEAASERDHRSPHIRIAFWARSCTIITRIRPVRHDPRVLDYDVSFCIGAPRTARTALVATRRPPTGYDRWCLDDVPSFPFSDALPHRTDLLHA
jgi:hypothetical protein